MYFNPKYEKSIYEEGDFAILETTAQKNEEKLEIINDLSNFYLIRTVIQRMFGIWSIFNDFVSFLEIQKQIFLSLNKVNKLEKWPKLVKTG